MQRIRWSYSSEKSNPRLPRQTGANRTVGLLKVLLQLAVKEGTISYSIQRLYSIKGDIICVLYYITVSRDQAQESIRNLYSISWCTKMLHGVQYSKIRCRWNSQLHTVFKVYWSQHRQQAHQSPESLISYIGAATLQLSRVSITILYMRTKTLVGSRTDGKCRTLSLQPCQ